MSIERYIETKGSNRGRIKDLDTAIDLAYTEDAWREENNGQPILAPPERLGKSEIHFRDILDAELKRLITVKAVEELSAGFDKVYADLVSRDDDPESSDERWLSYKIANRLLTIGEEHGFDIEICSEIYAMPFPESSEAAYGYLVQAGLNADDILAEFMGSSELESK